MPKISNEEWNRLAEKNARHAALIHVETGNAKKIAEVFADVPVLKTLEFLFKLAEKHRKERKMKKVQTILEAVALIDRETGEETDVVLQSKGSGKNQDTSVFVGRLTPAQVFGTPIEKKKHGIKALKPIKRKAVKAKKPSAKKAVKKSRI